MRMQTDDDILSFRYVSREVFDLLQTVSTEVEQKVTNCLT